MSGEPSKSVKWSEEKVQPVDHEEEEEEEEGSGLKEQSLATLDLGILSPLTPEVISRQATINVGTIGHVAHGKSKVVRAISGVKTVSTFLLLFLSSSSLPPLFLLSIYSSLITKQANSLFRLSSLPFIDSF